MVDYEARAAKRAETMRGRIRLAEGPSNRSTRYVRGLLSQLRAAGLVPQDLVIDERSRDRVKFHHEGRECELRPYGRWQFELKIARTGAEREEYDRLPLAGADPSFGRFLRAVLPQQPGLQGP